MDNNESWLERLKEDIRHELDIDKCFVALLIQQAFGLASKYHKVSYTLLLNSRSAEQIQRMHRHAVALIEKTRKKGVRLSVNGKKLHVDAPVGVMTPGLRAELTYHKSELLQLLAKNP